jgi:hypothetical protein
VDVRDVRIRASTHGHAPAELRARIAEFARRDRARRALRRFLPIFGAGCGALFIPPHVLWISLFTFTGAVLAVQRFRQPREILELAGPCPECASEQSLAPPQALPAIQRCPGCGAFLKLEELA